MVLALLYTPYALYLYFTGGLTSPTGVYPYGLEDPEFSLMVFTLIARLTSVVMGTGTVLVNYYTVKNLYGHRAGVVSALLIASSYAVIYYSHNANIDVPQLFWTSLALYHFVLLLKTYATKHYVWLGLFTALAIGTKDSIAALFPGLLLPLLYYHLQHEMTAGRRCLSALCHRKLLYGFSAFVIMFILAFNLPFNWQGFGEHVQFHLGRSVKGSMIIRESASVLQGDIRIIVKSFYYLLQANGLPAFLLLLGGVVYCLVRFPTTCWVLLLPIVTYYLFFLRAYVTVHLRYLLPVYLIFTWQAGKFAADLLDSRKIPRLLSTIVLLLIFAHALVYGFSLDLLLCRDSRYAAEAWMRKHIPDEATVIALGPDYGLPRFPAGMQVRRLLSRGRTRVSQEWRDIDPDYFVLDMSLPGRANQKSSLYQHFQEQGYRPVASFKSESPFFGVDLFHAVNPEIVIFARIDH
jgi:hypothetical protein